jgi:hypothetical protein
VEELGNPPVVHSGLSERFRDDGRLGKLNSETEVDNWVEETYKG